MTQYFHWPLGPWSPGSSGPISPVSPLSPRRPVSPRIPLSPLSPGGPGKMENSYRRCTTRCRDAGLEPHVWQMWMLLSHNSLLVHSSHVKQIHTKHTMLLDVDYEATVSALIISHYQQRYLPFSSPTISRSCWLPLSCWPLSMRTHRAVAGRSVRSHWCVWRCRSCHWREDSFRGCGCISLNALQTCHVARVWKTALARWGQRREGWKETKKKRRKGKGRKGRICRSGKLVKDDN